MEQKIAVLVNGTRHEVSGNDGLFLVDGRTIQPDIKQLGPGHWHVIIDIKGYDVKLSDGRDGKEISINGNIYTVDVQDRMAELLRSMGMNLATTAKASEVKAPMPGLVLRIEASPGQTVTKGEPLLVLEAMKMENVIKSPADGTVKSIEVTKGQAVEKGQALVKFA